MKVSKDYILRQVADETLLIPVGEAALTVKGLIGLSESACLLYGKLQQGCSREELMQTLLTEYDVPEAEASADLDAFLDQMRRLHMLEEE